MGQQEQRELELYTSRNLWWWVLMIVAGLGSWAGIAGLYTLAKAVWP